MNTAIIVDINTEREKGARVIVQEVNRTENHELVSTEDLNQIGLMSALCEGVSMLIHSAHKNGLKEDYKSVEDCTKHIQSGFADASYIAETKKETERILIEPLNAKIEITENKEEGCFDYLISNIKKVEKKYDDFHVCYAFYGDTLQDATIKAFKDLYEKYDEYLEFIS